MKEDFLHYIWQNGFFRHDHLRTNQSKALTIINKGQHNTNAGPDFLNAQIKIDGILWVGNVEIHKSASDWYAHGHEKDPAYDNIILHIVYEDNMPVYNSNNVQIPTLELSKIVDRDFLKNYNKLIRSKAILRCQNDISAVDKFVLFHFKYRLYLERLEEKYEIIERLLMQTHNNWAQIFYETLLKYIGGSVNAAAFELLARLLPYKVFIKYADSLIQLEALLFGVAGFLNEDRNDAYFQMLKQEYTFLKEKHNLEELPEQNIRFHRLRPSNFPTIRLAQFARIYYQTDRLFDRLIRINTIKDAYEILTATASCYWDTHYNFEKATKFKKKTTGTDFMDIILINVILPLQFAYQKYQGIEDSERIISLIEQIKPEKNKIINIFNKINLPAKNALDSQAILQLNKRYCLANKCLSCAIGHHILKQGLNYDN